jgi:hypothetical protein
MEAMAPLTYLLSRDNLFPADETYNWRISLLIVSLVLGSAVLSLLVYSRYVTQQRDRYAKKYHSLRRLHDLTHKYQAWYVAESRRLQDELDRQLATISTKQAINSARFTQAKGSAEEDADLFAVGEDSSSDEEKEPKTRNTEHKMQGKAAEKDTNMRPPDTDLDNEDARVHTRRSLFEELAGSEADEDDKSDFPGQWEDNAVQDTTSSQTCAAELRSPSRYAVPDGQVREEESHDFSKRQERGRKLC